MIFKDAIIYDIPVGHMILDVQKVAAEIIRICENCKEKENESRNT